MAKNSNVVAKAVLILMSTYCFFKTASLPAAQKEVRQDISGSFLRCTKADAVFEMALDGQGWFQFQKGLKVNVAFTSVAFRSLAGATAANAIEFYYGTADVEDSRLSVLGENESSVNTRLVDSIINTLNSGGTVLAPTDVLGFTGLATYWTGYKNVTLRRRWLRITNMDATDTLDIGTGSVGSGLWGAVFPRSSETFYANGIINVQNNSANNITCRFAEVFDLIF